MSDSELKVTDAKSWKGNGKGLGVIHTVPMPSGNVARLRRPGLDVFLRLGLIPNTLMSIISKHISEAQAGKETDEAELGKELATLAEDPERIADIMQFADNVLIHCAVEPEVHPIPASQAERDENFLYVDEVDFDDKMFIFGWAVGGDEDLDRFRAGQKQMLGTVADVTATGDQA